MRRYEVTMERKRGLNQRENARQQRAYVIAADEDGARNAARRQYPEFFPTHVRKV